VTRLAEGSGTGPSAGEGGGPPPGEETAR